MLLYVLYRDLIICHIDLTLGDAERQISGGQNGDPQPLLDEILEIIRSNRTAVAKALAFLDIDERENSLSDSHIRRHDDFERQIEFEAEGSGKGTRPCF